MTKCLRQVYCYTVVSFLPIKRSDTRFLFNLLRSYVLLQNLNLVIIIYWTLCEGSPAKLLCDCLVSHIYITSNVHSKSSYCNLTPKNIFTVSIWNACVKIPLLIQLIRFSIFSLFPSVLQVPIYNLLFRPFYTFSLSAVLCLPLAYSLLSFLLLASSCHPIVCLVSPLSMFV
jgi:hypothetical protein